MRWAEGQGVEYAPLSLTLTLAVGGREAGAMTMPRDAAESSLSDEGKAVGGTIGKG